MRSILVLLVLTMFAGCGRRENVIQDGDMTVMEVKKIDEGFRYDVTDGSSADFGHPSSGFFFFSDKVFNVGDSLEVGVIEE